MVLMVMIMLTTDKMSGTSILRFLLKNFPLDICIGTMNIVDIVIFEYW